MKDKKPNSDEITYLNNLVSSVNYDKDMFTVYYGYEGKLVIGVISQTDKIDRLFEYKSLFESVLHTDWAIKFSLNYAIEYAYKNEESLDNLFSSATGNERTAAHFTENAVFRTVILWNILAQFYNIKYNIVADASKVFYKSFFRDQLVSSNTINASTINEYIEQPENIKVEPWQGNHIYVNDYRNQMAHRNSPNVTTMSNYATELRLPMRYVLKRVVEDYSMVSFFIKDFLQNIDIEQLYELE